MRIKPELMRYCERVNSNLMPPDWRQTFKYKEKSLWKDNLMNN